MTVIDLPTAPLAAEETFEHSAVLLRAIGSRERADERVLRIHTPLPTLAMSRWESRQSGFAAASESALRFGFAPAIRPTGGRAAAYDESCLVFDLVVREEEGIDPQPLFASTSARLAAELAALGVDARVGAVAGEYCPGEYSINARGAVKLIGTSQRAVRGARLLSGVIALGSTEHLIPVLDAANAALGLDWDPSTLGGLASEIGRVGRQMVVDALIAALAE
ncbi:lipoate--protein ligase family protein [Microbacterium esteraromaticum]|uniref:Lipoate--protein ligase family protein n=1 Tax=Microbacterium esteraromaticum TaxID=57043 RepID=A0A7D8AI09_9MICO|nr:lipoate--protein ligase family protein [Microbacterium esteraromaticum]QMU96189.1 lipoate--protein ligase family protein [Microbacterium esteraromaticum]